MRKTLALTLIAASLVAGGSAFARGAGNNGYDVMSPSTPDPEAVVTAPFTGGTPSGADLGSAQSHAKAGQPMNALPGASEHAWGQENALYGS